MITYWLYHENRCIAAVRLPKGATLAEVKRVALSEHRHPTIEPIIPCKDPAAFESMLNDATEVKVTYWLFYGKRCLTSVRLPAGATLAEVTRAALIAHDKMPTLGPNTPYEAPFEFESVLRRATEAVVY